MEHSFVIDEFLRVLFATQWRVLLFTVVLMVGATEVGFLFGLRLHRAKDSARSAQIGVVEGGILGLLGLLLGFTFAMAVGRYEARRDLVVREANAIGTTYLRSSFLPDSQQAGVADLLRRYLDLRIEFYEAGENRHLTDATEQKTLAAQRELWERAVTSAKQAPSPIVATFINSLNEMFDIDALRYDALKNHVPGVVWLLVLGVGACGCGAAGYGAGAGGLRSGFSNVALPLLIAVAITLIADLDRPRGGLIRINQGPLTDLKQVLVGPPK
jgi:hypothetical protein